MTGAGSIRIAHEIEPSLGVVVVDLWGALLEVRLDRPALRRVPPDTVDARILRAIQAAEAHAQRMVARYVEDRPGRAAAGYAGSGAVPP